MRQATHFARSPRFGHGADFGDQPGQVCQKIIDHFVRVLVAEFGAELGWALGIEGDDD